MGLYLFGAIAVLFVMTIAGAYLLVLDKKKKSKAKKGLPGKKRWLSKRTYARLATFFEKNFLTRGDFQKILEGISELAVYGPQECAYVAVDFYLIANAALFGLILAGIIIFRDLFSVLLVILYAVVFKECVIYKQIDKIKFQVMKALSQALASITQNYMRTGSIPDSLGDAEVPKILQNVITDIHLILISNDAEERLEAFYSVTPFRLLQTLAGVSYILNNEGESKDSHGVSNYVTALQMLSDEVNMDIRRVATAKAKFGVLAILPVLPMFAMGGIEYFFASVIPGTTVIYKGTLGYLSRVVIILASILGFAVISRINSTMAVSKDDRNGVAVKLLDFKIWEKIVRNIIPKKSRKVDKKNRQLRGALSLRTLPTLYSEKLLYGIIGFVAVLLICNYSVNLGREFVYNNVSEMSLISTEKLTQEDIDARKRFDEKFLALPELPSDEQIRKYVEASIPGLDGEFEIANQVDRVTKKYNKYHNSYFKFWMVILAWGAAFVCYNVPEILIRVRAWLLSTESEEDVLQLQTLIVILMNTSIDTLECLFWMQRQSRIHKNILIECYHEYSADPELALLKLKRRTNSVEFRRMIDTIMLTVDDISLKDAFGGLVAERSHVMKLREVAQNTSIMRKRFLVSPLAMAPLYLTAICYILLPIGILGAQEFVNAIQNMQM